MPDLLFQISDEPLVCVAGAYGAPGASMATASAARLAVVGGDIGFGSDVLTIGTSQSNKVIGCYELPRPIGFDRVLPGTGNISFGIVSDTGNPPRLNAVYLVQVSGSCEVVQTVSSVTGLTVSLTVLGSGQISQDFQIETSKKLASTDKMMLILVGDNTSSMTAATCTITSYGVITLPMGLEGPPEGSMSCTGAGR